MKKIGRLEKVIFPNLHLVDIDAKIDTGAYRSALHCHEIQKEVKDGVKMVRFKILDPSHEDYKDKEFYLPIFAEEKVKSSSGHTKKRIFIKTYIYLYNQKIELELSLTDRSKMKYPVLLGRKILKNRFLVDVSKKYLAT